MNPYNFNGQSGFFLRIAICDYLRIPYSDIYRIVKNIDCNTSTIILHDGRKFKLTLQEIT